jgi:hypothetical protein
VSTDSFDSGFDNVDNFFEVCKIGWASGFETLAGARSSTTEVLALAPQPPRRRDAETP